MKRFIFPAVLYGVVVGSASAQNIVTNGSFETGSLSPWTVDANSQRTNVFVNEGGFEGTAPADGTHDAVFGAGGPNSGKIDGEIDQSFPTTVGTTYTGSLQYAGVGDGTATLQVNIGNPTTFESYPGFPVLLTPSYNGRFQTYTFSFTATLALSGIDLIGFNNNVSGADVLVDNVVIVPEPGCAFALAVGALTLVGRRRR